MDNHTSDMLETMLNLQGNLQERLIGVNPANIDDAEKRIEFIRNMILALTDELHEVLNETGWKPWATSRHINEEAFKNELIDAWHFFMNLILVSGMSPDEFYIRYRQKREKNIKRNREGYDGLNKCPSCKRAYDDDAVECTPASPIFDAICTHISSSSDMM